MAPPEKNIGGNDVIFYGVIRNSDKQLNCVFDQLILRVAAYLFTAFLRKIFAFALDHFYWQEAFELHLRFGKPQYVANPSID